MLFASKLSLAALGSTGSYGSSWHDRLQHGVPPMYRHSFRRATVQRDQAAAGVSASSTAGSPVPAELATQGRLCPATDNSSVNNIAVGGLHPTQKLGSGQSGAAGAPQVEQEAEDDSLWQELQQLREQAAQQAQLLEQQQQALQAVQARLAQQRQQQLRQRRQRQLWQLQEEEGAPALSSSSSSMAQPAPACQLWLPCADSSLGCSSRLEDDFDARFPSTGSNCIPRDLTIMPPRIILVRHAESEGNVDAGHYTYMPDPQVALTARGWEQAAQAGQAIRALMEADGHPSWRLYFYTSPFKRTKQTCQAVMRQFSEEQLLGMQEDVQLREQDFGNFQDAEGKRLEKAERMRFGRFFYRFPNGESGADVFSRVAIFQDHLLRDINAGRFGRHCSLVLVTHGLAARIFLMRWFHWTTEQFLSVWNPPLAEPIVLERVDDHLESRQGSTASWVHTKALFRLTGESQRKLLGCTDDMCYTSCRPRSFRIPHD